MIMMMMIIRPVSYAIELYKKNYEDSIINITNY